MTTALVQSRRICPKGRVYDPPPVDEETGEPIGEQRLDVHHPDKHAKNCVNCDAPLVDTVDGWLR